MSGSINRVDPADRFAFGPLLLWHAAALPRYLAMMMIGVTLVLIAPGTMAAIADGPRLTTALSILNGLAVVGFGPLMLTTLGLFVITLPVALAGGALLLLAMYLSMAVVGLTAGRVALRSPLSTHDRRLDVLAVCAGITALAIARVLPVPFLGLAVSVATAITGVGAIVIWAEGPHRSPRPRSTWPIASFLAGALAGGLIVTLAMLSIIAAFTGALAAVATLSRSALFTWEVAPKRLAATALVLAGGALLTGAVWLVSRMRGRSRKLEQF